MTHPEATGKISRVLRGDAVGDTMYSERWILRQLIRLTKFISGEEDFSDDFETDLCTLWDMCADKDVILLTRKHGLIALAVNTIMKSQSPRLSEIMVGIIGNMCTLKSVREECKRRADVIKVVMELLAFPDSPTLIQVMRVLQTFAWEVSNSCMLSPQGRKSEDGEQVDNDHEEIDHDDDYENDYDPMQVHYGDEENDGHDGDAGGNDNVNNPSQESSEESSLSDNMEEDVEHALPTSSNETVSREEGNLNIGCASDVNKSEAKQYEQKETEFSPSTSQSQGQSVEKKIVESSSREERKETGNEPEEMVIPVEPEFSDESSDGVIESVTAASDIPGPSTIAGPSGTVSSTSETDNDAVSVIDNNEDKDAGESSAAGGSSMDGGKCIVDNNDDVDEDENPEVVAVSVGDDSVITSTAILWYDQFLKVDNWLPEVVYILNSSKNAELIGLTWSLLSVLCYIKVGDSFLCCNISGPDVMRGLLESFKEFFGQHADLENSELYDVSKCRKGLVAWTSVMYSFTFHEDCESSCCVFKAVIMKNVFKMLTFFTHFLPMDGDLQEYLIHSFTILDHVLMSEPYELSSLRSGINGVLQILEDLTEEKQKQKERNIYPRYEDEAIDTTERYLLNVLVWLNRLHNANRLGEFEDVRVKLIAKLH